MRRDPVCSKDTGRIVKFLQIALIRNLLGITQVREKSFENGTLCSDRFRRVVPGSPRSEMSGWVSLGLGLAVLGGFERPRRLLQA